MRIYTLQQTIKLNPHMNKGFFCNVIGLVARSRSLSLSLCTLCVVHNSTISLLRTALYKWFMQEQLIVHCPTEKNMT